MIYFIKSSFTPLKRYLSYVKSIGASYYLYNELSKFNYFITRLFIRTSALRNPYNNHLHVEIDRDRFKSSKFYILNNQNIELYAHLSPVFEQINISYESPSPRILRNTEYGVGYSVYHGIVSRNVTYVSTFTNESICGIRDYLIHAGIKNFLEDYFQSYVGICNVRAYRRSNNPPVSATHYLESFSSGEGSLDVLPHFDSIPYRNGKSLKIMVFADGLNPKFKGVDVEHGPLEIYVSGKWKPIIGSTPTTVIFDSNRVLHRAMCPHEGFLRDCLELTILPKIEQDFPIIVAGSHSGAPLNPFYNWSSIFRPHRKKS